MNREAEFQVSMPEEYKALENNQNRLNELRDKYHSFEADLNKEFSPLLSDYYTQSMKGIQSQIGILDNIVKTRAEYLNNSKTYEFASNEYRGEKDETSKEQLAHCLKDLFDKGIELKGKILDLENSLVKTYSDRLSSQKDDSAKKGLEKFLEDINRLNQGGTDPHLGVA
jgi:Rad3-related DNA helicase